MSQATLVSAYPKTDGAFPRPHSGGGGNGVVVEGLGVVADVNTFGSVTWTLMFQVPQSLPSGTCKARIIGVTSASTGDAKIDVQWKSYAASENPSSGALNSETVATVTISAANTFHETKITLDADTVVAAEFIVMDVVFTATSWTLAAESTWFISVIWE